MANRKSGRITLTTRPPAPVAERLRTITDETTYSSLNQIASDMLEAAVQMVDDPSDPPAVPEMILRLRHQLRGAPAPDTRVDALTAQIRELTETVHGLQQRIEGLRPTSARHHHADATRRASGKRS